MRSAEGPHEGPPPTEDVRTRRAVLGCFARARAGGPQRNKRAGGASLICRKKAPGPREHSDADGGTRAECSPETGEKGSRRRVSIAPPSSAGAGTDCPRRGAHEILARGIEAGWPRRVAARFTRA
jgi:hypothetical protein